MKHYNDLLNLYGNTLIPYSELLQTQEWLERRKSIINRDNHLCTQCKTSETFYHKGSHFWFKYTEDEERIKSYLKKKEEKKKLFFSFPIDEQNRLKSSKLFSMDPLDDIIDMVPSDKSYYLQVHHKYYQKGKLPWEYPDEALTALCWECHENLHKNIKVPYLNEAGIEIGTLNPCARCHGAGWFPEFNHIQNGICFRCNGKKYEEFLS